MIITKEEFNNIRLFFSLALENYENVGDKEELLKMAEVTNEDIDKFLNERNILIV